MSLNPAVIAPGQKLNLNFRLKILRAGVANEMTFAELLTRRTIVSVYMKNNTPSCDRQNDALVEHAAAFDRAGFNVIAISRDTIGSHRRYAAMKQISHVLASDPEDRFAQAADSLVEKTMYGRTFVGPARAVFVLERDGTVLAVAEKVDTAAHAAQIERLLARLER